MGAISCLGPSLAALSGELEKSGIKNGVGPVAPEWLEAAPASARDNRALALSVIAAREAMEQAGWGSPGAEDALILATTTGQILQWDSGFMDFVNGRSGQDQFLRVFRNQPLGELLNSVRDFFRFRGPATLLTSACSASTQALALGAMWLRQGRVKRCLVLGCEVLCDLTLLGFRSLQLLSDQTCRPFDLQRQGINLSEGAAALCLESGARGPLAEISGFGFSTDGYHMTGPHPEGEGSFRAMSAAVNSAGLAPAEIHWVHAHGTGSQLNDLAEGLAISRLFGGERPWVSSTKWLHGHALAASGALETALVVNAMREGRILRTRGLTSPDPKIPVRHPETDLALKVKHVLKNTSGFGGANAALVLSRPGAGRA
jgi:3-oxoacyl-(acyl-carrier-protein) synthase